ncbi:ABC transporter ATP-binding protein [Ectothiorhodospira lacustris]|uniref:ABC transporter ATP-binding protein n=1 Tax=Ectothiorhodospira lacustris TaxID=2899127 RepID=UPI001EE78CD7|nr:ABC transporter ATP-binding protein [Ectothiorhodospira lacustris]MCG5501086.1 ABC transporter ATP-binding protein [Ectothiorhodospira lacustris]MCG5511189.1 ABC transporter ATP-binding protein [Ectothiorhodospira lacustris]MCG5522853.1 ABC transporter ATP-binding protein [Ectothiorhodospira lacustris]
MSGLMADVRFRHRGFSLDVALGVPPGGVTALLGPSGCGKTTLLRLLAGLERPGDGVIQRGDRIWFDSSRRVHLPTRRRRVGFMFQQYALFPHLTVAGNIAFGLPSKRDHLARVNLWLERLHLQGLERRYPGSLSGGQKQRVALARALAPEPDVLLLDEPFSAVDQGLRRDLRLLFQEVIAAQGIPVIVVTHDLDDARYIADRAGVMIQGRLRRLGPTEQVFAQPGDVQVAQVLGWSNLLPVAGVDQGHAWGGWGRLPLPASARGRHLDRLAVHPEGPRLVSDGDGLAGQVTRVMGLGRRTLVICRLEDRTPLQIVLTDGCAVPRLGECMHVRIPLDCVTPLHNGSLP